MAMTSCCPRIKHCNKWALVTSKVVPEGVVDFLNAVRFGTGEYLYVFPGKYDNLSDIYCEVAKAFDDFGFDTEMIIFEIENSSFAY